MEKQGQRVAIRDPGQRNHNGDRIVSQTNGWLSFSSHFNEEEQELQERSLKEGRYRGVPIVNDQLEKVYRMLCLLNYQEQLKESTKVPSVMIPHTITLNLLNAGEGGAALDQVLPGNNSRNQMHIMAAGATAFIGALHLQSLPALGTPLVRVPYFELPVGNRWPINAKGPVYAIGSSATIVCTLTIVEEVFATPMVLSKLWKIANREERKLIGHNWLESLEDI
jgi:hypothetical protein